MTDDIRIKTGLITHRKWRRLRLSNAAMCAALLEIWCSLGAADSADGMIGTVEDVDAVAGCPGACEALTAAGFLENIGGVFHAHDWCEHQRWVVSAPERKAAARASADARWHAERMRHASGAHALTKNPQCSVSVSDSLPIPTPSEKKKKTPAAAPPDSAFEAFWETCPRKVGKGAAVKAWSKLPQESRAAALEAMPRHATYWKAKGTEERFIPHVSTWLNAGRWDDVLEGPETPKKKETATEILARLRAEGRHV